MTALQTVLFDTAWDILESHRRLPSAIINAVLDSEAVIADVASMLTTTFERCGPDDASPPAFWRALLATHAHLFHELLSTSVELTKARERLTDEAAAAMFSTQACTRRAMQMAAKVYNSVVPLARFKTRG